MDINDFGRVTLYRSSFFLGVMGWDWSNRNRHRFDDAAQLPFRADGDDVDARP